MIYNRSGTYLTKEEFLPIVQSFTLKNLKKIQAITMQMWNAYKLPDEIKHYENTEEGMVKVPAGIRSVWGDRFEDKYGDITIINHPELLNPFGEDEDLSLTEKQNKALEEVLTEDSGLLHASTGVGKTSVIAKIIDRKKCKTLIVCSGIELMTQMREDMEIFFGVKCRTLSGSKTKQKGCYEDIVIGNIDTLIKQDDDFIGQFDLILMDEADKYLSAETRLGFLFRLPAKYQYALTGTIKVNHTPDEIFSIYFGKKTELLLKHFNPNIYKVFTKFQYVLDDIKAFYELKAALYENEERNDLIVKTIIDTLDGRKGIVFSEYIEHAKGLQKKLEEKEIKTFLLIGEVKSEDRARIKKELKEYNGPCVLIGSVKIIGRGFNVPELSVGYLTTCEKFNSNINQYVGRVIRKFKDKTGCSWYDFVDRQCRLLENQAKTRNTNYRKEFPKSNIEFY